MDQNDDTVNAILFVRHRHRPLHEVLETLRIAHAATRTRLATRPFFRRGLARSRSSPGSPGSTLQHYDEHHRWIRALAGRA